MLYRIKIVLTSPLMGSQATRERIRKFRRGSVKDSIEIDPDFWFWTLREACQMVEGLAGYDVTTMRIPQGIIARNITPYNHRYSAAGKPLSELFESVRKGAQLTFDVLLTDPEPGGMGRRVDAATMNKIMTCVGHYIGLSPWGSKFNFGRFDVISVEPVVL